MVLVHMVYTNLLKLVPMEVSSYGDRYNTSNCRKLVSKVD